MRWHAESWLDYKARMFQWRDHFALLPVFCHAERQTVWLETVQRRIEYTRNGFRRFRSVEYRLRPTTICTKDDPLGQRTPLLPRGWGHW